MTIASVGTLGTGAHSTSASSFAFSTATNALAAGDFALLAVATDNLQTTASPNPSPSTNHSTVAFTDTVNRGRWTKLGEQTNGQGVAAAGATISLWLFEATASVPTTTGITVTLSGGSLVDKTCTFWKFTKAAGMAIRLFPPFAANPIANAVNASNGFGSLSLTSSPSTSASRLYVRVMAKEANSTTGLTVSSGFTQMTAQRSRNNASAICVRGEFRINTSTGETSNPTMAVSGDTVSIFAALEEYDPLPVITTQPLNAFVIAGQNAEFAVAGTDYTSLKWQELIAGGGGGGANYIADSAQPLVGGANAITIPPSAQSAVLFSSWWHGGASTPGWACTALPDLNTNRVFTNGNSSPPYQSGMLRTTSTVTATGAQTLTLSGQTDIFNGPVGFILFFDGPIEVIDGDANSVGDTGSAAIVLDSETGATVLVLDSNLDTTTPPTTPAGWTELQTVGNNSQSATLRMKTSSGSSESIASTSPNYETLIAYSIRGGGGGATWTDVSGATTSTLSLSGVTTADNERKFRPVLINSFGERVGNEVTLFVSADGRLELKALSTAPAEAPTDTSTKNIGAPAGIVQGHRELLLVGVGSVSGTPTINPISGWADNPLWQSGVLSIGGGVFTLRLAAFERKATGPGATVVATSTASGYWGWHRTAWAFDAETFIESINWDDLVSTTLPTLPAVTPASDYTTLIDWLVLGMSAAISPGTSGMTELSENTDHAIALYGKNLDDTSAVGARTYEFSPTADAGFANIVLRSLASELGGDGGITGSLFVQESGNDTLTASGVVPIAGSLARQESGGDSFAGSGAAQVQGALTATEGPDTFSGVGAIPVVATLVVVEAGSDSFSATGATPVAGALSAQEVGADTFDAAGVLQVTGALAAVESPDTLNAVGVVQVSGTATIVEGTTDTLAANGEVRVIGVLAAQEVGSDTFNGSGVSGATGSLFVVESGSDTFAGAAALVVAGTLGAVEGSGDTLSGAVVVQVTGALSAIEIGGDTFTGAGEVGGLEPGTGNLFVQESGPDTFTGSAAVDVTGALSAVEGPDIFTGSASVRVVGSFVVTEQGSDGFVGQAAARVAGTLMAQESGSDSATLSGQVRIVGALSVRETGSDTASLTGNVTVSAAMTAAEGGADSASGEGVVAVTGTLVAVESGGDTFAGDADTGAGYNISPQHARWLYQLALLHGLDPEHPLTVAKLYRATDNLFQTVSESPSGVTLETTSAPPNVGMEPSIAIEALARVHALLDSLLVSTTQRAAGDLTQTIESDGESTVVTRVS